MSARTVKVSNVSVKATEREIKEFFSFSGTIEFMEVKKSEEDEETQIAYVTFKDAKGAETAVLLSGATIADKMVTISVDEEYQLPPDALTTSSEQESNAEGVYWRAEDVVSSMLAKGFLLGTDAVNKAKELDEKHKLSRTASAKVASIDQKMGLTEKISLGTAIVNDKVKEVDEKYQVSEKTKSALAAAEQKVSSAGSAIMKNRYVFTSAAWVTGAFNRVAKAAGEVGQKAQEKLAEEKLKAVEASEGESPGKDDGGADNVAVAEREGGGDGEIEGSEEAAEPSSPMDAPPGLSQALEVPPKAEDEAEKV